MECRQVQELVQEFLDDELDRALREQFLDHLTQCDACKTEVRSQQIFAERLGRLPLEVPPDGARQAILAAVGAEGGLVSSRGAAGLWARLASVFAGNPGLAVAGVAAVALLAVGTLGMFDAGRTAVAVGAPLDVRLVVQAGVCTVNGAAPGKASEDGVALRDRDRLEAGADFKGQLTWADGTRVRVDPGSAVVVHAERLELKIGRVWVKVTKRPDQRFAVETPLAVAAVKGTSFDVVHDAVSGTLVKVFEGLVSVLDLAGDGSAVDVGGNRWAIVSDKGTLKVGDFSDDGSVVNDLKPFFRSDR